MKSTIDPAVLLRAAQQTPQTTADSQRDRQALKKSCQDFEAIFVQSLFQAMRKTVPEGGLFEESSPAKLYQDMLDQEIATQISRRQSLGLAEQMYRQMEQKLPAKK